MSKKTTYILIGLAVIVVIGIFSIFVSAGFSGFGPGLADYEYRIAGSCTLNRYSAHEINIDCDGINDRINAEVSKVGWNDQYLVASTHPDTKRKYPDDPNNTYTEPDESITYWWIRDLVNKKGYGPMSEVEFNQKKAELKMPDIRLLSVDEAKAKGTVVSGSTQ